MTYSKVDTAIVEPGAVIGDGTRLWHHVQVRTGARIGADCNLGKGVFVDEGVTIGDRVKIQNYVSVYRGVTIGDEVMVGPSAVFTNDLFPRAVNPGWRVVPTVVERGVGIGANATVVCGVTLGAWSMVAAGAVVTRDVESHALVAGVPARTVGWVCACGAVISREPERPTATTCGRCRT